MQSTAQGSPDSKKLKNEIGVTFGPNGVIFSHASAGGPDWLQTTISSGQQRELASLLSQLHQEAYCFWKESGLVLPWMSLYGLFSSQEYAESFPILGLPTIDSWRPILQSSGSLSDPDFSIFSAGWISPNGIRAEHGYSVIGGTIRYSGTLSLIPYDAWRTAESIREFHSRKTEERTPDSNRRSWAKIREHALAARADLSDFLKQTVVLTPARLRLELRKGGSESPDLVEVLPTFDQSPRRWLEFFDRSSGVPSRYDIPDGEGLTQILLPPETQSVLVEIKRMPARRIVGDRAEAFIRNPFAMLGPDANKVIDPAEFEHSRELAGMQFTRFTPQVFRDTQGLLLGVGLQIEEISESRIEQDVVQFADPEDLEDFIRKLEQRISRNAQCCSWNGHDLEILGETPEHLEVLRGALVDWRTPRRFTAAEILDLSKYSQRIEGFGVEKPYYSPFIARKNDNLPWLPENIVSGVFFTSPGSQDPVALELDEKALLAFKEELEHAKAHMQESFLYPGCPQPIKVSQAELIVQSIEEARRDVYEHHFHVGIDEATKSPKEHKGLIVKANIVEVDYEERRGSLRLPDELEVRLPGSLKPEFPLKDHQLKGVRWLQHLWSCSPNSCRGALLADDMGLGKTLQLLAFIAAELDKNPGADPCLIVAPVSLLENWKEEIEKFFEAGALKILTLYGASLSKLRLSRAEIDEDLQSAGVGRLLVRNWLAGARIVLTTYETLRDLEFSLSRQRWSIMVCDEAQKVKNPNALVSRAAKKQNARFKIACTGTPVENTLTDLWCLFDFIQPGLLGSLSKFGERYRKPIEAETEDEKARIQELRELIEPQKLRRTKSEVAKDLPKKIEENDCRKLQLSDRQRVLYSQAIANFRNSDSPDSSGGVRNHLGLLQHLRRVCSDPHAVYGDPETAVTVEDLEKHSPKLHWLLLELKRIRDKGEKAIIFCELRELQRKLQSAIADRFRIVPDIINGDTSAAPENANNRQRRIKQFQSDPGFGVIILSPLAVGFGVNIQAANHVIHFTRTWNPAKEDQATDRAYRIGQTKDVYVYYPVVVAPDFVTFDAKLDHLLHWKRALSDDMLNGTGELTAAEFSDLQDVNGKRAFD